jgi:hypothetical protein
VRAVQARGWDSAIPSVLSGAVPGSSPGEWELFSATNLPNLRRRLSRTLLQSKRGLLQGAPSGPDGGSGPLRIEWRRLSRTPSLDAWRLSQPGPANSLCASQLCAALLAAGVDLDPALPIAISPDPDADLTSRRAAAQATVAMESASNQRRASIGAIVGGAIGGFVGLVVLLALLPRLLRCARARRAAAAAADVGGKPAVAAVADVALQPVAGGAGASDNYRVAGEPDTPVPWSPRGAAAGITARVVLPPPRQTSPAPGEVYGRASGAARAAPAAALLYEPMSISAAPRGGGGSGASWLVPQADARWAPAAPPQRPVGGAVWGGSNDATQREPSADGSRLVGVSFETLRRIGSTDLGALVGRTGQRS